MFRMWLMILLLAPETRGSSEVLSFITAVLLARTERCSGLRERADVAEAAVRAQHDEGF